MTGSLWLHVEQAAGTPDDFTDGGEAIASVEPLQRLDIPETVALDDLVIPIKAANQQGAHQINNLPVGRYRVSVRLPSGRVLNRLADVVSDKPAELTFVVEGPGSESLTWQSYAGAFTHQIEQQVRAKTRSSTPEPKVNRYDNLTLIKGIGPAIETALNRAGIDRIAQIAEVRDYGLEMLPTVAPFLKRLDNSGWVEQAADILTRLPKTEEESGESSDDPGVAVVLEAGVIRLTEGFEGSPSLLGAVATLIRSNLSQEQTLTENIDSLYNAVPGAAVDHHIQNDIVISGRDNPLTTTHFAPGGEPQAPDRFEQSQPLERIYLVAEDTQVQWLFCLPKPWLTIDERPVGIDVTFDLSDPNLTALNLIPQDARVASLLGFMRSGDIRASGAVLDNAKYMLFEKQLNPYSAAAGGLVLINARRWGGLEADPRRKTRISRRSILDGDWGRWLENLNNWSPWLPDAKVLLAWHKLLKSGGEPSPEQLDEARELLVRAATGGLPVYSWTLRLLVDGLKMVRHEDEEQKQHADPLIEQAFQDAMTVSMRTDMRQIFAAIRLTPRNRSGLSEG